MWCGLGDGRKLLAERVQIPVNRTITAFGPGGVVYLTSRDGVTTKLEKATVR